MEPIEQAVNLIKKSKAIGLALKEHADGDEIASLSALYKTLSSLGKTVNIIFSGELQKNFSKVFPGDSIPQGDTATLSDFVIAINSASAPIKELRYQRTKDCLEIILTPKDRPITKESVTFRQGQALSDVTITIGAHSLSDIGKAFGDSPEIFYEKPVIVIDNSAENENFGEINLTDPTKSSISEIVAEMILELAPDSMDEKIATLLLFGMVEKTNNFRSSRTKPSTLSAAAELVSKGGKMDDIVRVLWKTRPLPLMQIWGRASIRSRMDDKNKLLLSVLTKEDFVKTAVSPKEALPFVLKHIEEHFSIPENFAMLWQHPEEAGIKVIFKISAEQRNRSDIEPWWGGNGYQSFKKQYPSFREAEEAVYSIIQPAFSN